MSYERSLEDLTTKKRTWNSHLCVFHNGSGAARHGTVHRIAAHRRSAMHMENSGVKAAMAGPCRALMCAKNLLLIFSGFLDIWENVEWPRFFGPPCTYFKFLILGTNIRYIPNWYIPTQMPLPKRCTGLQL